MLNLFKNRNKDTSATSMTSFWWFILLTFYYQKILHIALNFLLVVFNKNIQATAYKTECMEQIKCSNLQSVVLLNKDLAMRKKYCFGIFLVSTSFTFGIYTWVFIQDWYFFILFTIILKNNETVHFARNSSSQQRNI